ncbi:hypothetical protein ICN48_04495 [Polynucleobacter sp. JS-Safj-400b-B2]|uniref:TorF family putative porin n=1 Tax=Polynucleobacter sp. JS-Safj-400b-B2 TaxID=2576921 RepID=UPI001C0E0571|nr:TorF family putative porin [Polynucleobacter sp. JS-Safj-400b-B2]MBU3625494.1 hypothetical protein [Polynucleobacter sp. JS-Safj-400b-B2]
MKTIHKTAISAAAVALLTGLASSAAFAADEPAAEVEVSPITANVTVTNNYIYRGITQSNYKPAVQGGFDYAHESGFYIGNWNSSISWVSDAKIATSAPVEMDFYGGFKKDLIAEGFASDFGILQYYYPTSGTIAGSINPNTTELYVAQNATFGPVTGFLKFSYALSNTFAFANSTGSSYLDLTGNYDTGFWGITANAHVGMQRIAGQYYQGGQASASYTDWKLGLTKDFGGGLSLAAAYVGTNVKQGSGLYANTYGQSTVNGRNAGGQTGIVSLTKTF